MVAIRCLSSPFLTGPAPRRPPAVSTTTPSNLCCCFLNNTSESSLCFPRPLDHNLNCIQTPGTTRSRVWFRNVPSPVIRDALVKRSFQWLASSRFSMLCAVRNGMCGASSMDHESSNGRHTLAKLSSATQRSRISLRKGSCLGGLMQVRRGKFALAS